MNRYERISIAIDSTTMTAELLAFAGELARATRTEIVDLLHVSRDESASPQFSAMAVAEGIALPIAVPLEEETADKLEDERDRLLSLGRAHFQYLPERAVRVEMLNGSPIFEVLRHAYDKSVDLLVIGRSYGTTGDDTKALAARRITRKATCSVLTVPEAPKWPLERIIVPVRDSECSANALQAACEIAASVEAAVFPFNLYRVDLSTSSPGASLGEYQAALELIAKEECRNLLRRIDTHDVPIELFCRPDLFGRSSREIREAAEHLNAQAIVIGARGRTGAAGVLLGAITEQLIGESPVPVLAVKKKGECIGVLRALLTLATS